MTSITVREARAGDFAALLRLLDQMDESMYRGRGHAGEGDIRALYEAILPDPDQRLLVVEENGRIVGSAHVMVLRHLGRSLSRSAVVEGVEIIPVRFLTDAVGFLTGELPIDPASVDLEEVFAVAGRYAIGFDA